MSDNLLDKMLLVVDGSEPSIAAANYAVGLAAQTGGHITAVYVVDTATMEYLSQMRIFIAEERSEFEQDLERTGHRYLDYVRTIGHNHGIDIEGLQLKGAFHQVILQKAREMEADVIVLGGWYQTVTRKDVASKQRQLILDEAACPVLVVKKR